MYTFSINAGSVLCAEGVADKRLVTKVQDMDIIGSC